MTKFLACLGFAITTCGISGDAFAQYFPGFLGTVAFYFPGAQPGGGCGLPAPYGSPAIGFCVETVKCAYSDPFTGNNLPDDIPRCKRAIFLDDILRENFGRIDQLASTHAAKLIELEGKNTNLATDIQRVESKIDNTELTNQVAELFLKNQQLEERLKKLESP